MNLCWLSRVTAGNKPSDSDLMAKEVKKRIKTENPKTRVALISCPDYTPEHVTAAVKRGLKLLGGLEKFVTSGEQILLKPNLLSAHPPADCVTTHPALFQAVAEICQQTGIKVSYGDSPTRGNALKAAQKAGIAAVARQLNVPFQDFRNGQSVSFAAGHQNKKFKIANAVLESDGLISLPKLKTHHLTRLTGAVKNQFGCVAGFDKLEFHVKLPGVDLFSKMLVDLNLLLKPRLYIMDAVQAMEGNGPGGGEPYPLKLIMLSADPVAMDSVACQLLNVKPDRLATSYYGAQSGLGQWQPDRIELVGDPWSDFRAPDFDIQRGVDLESNLALRFRFAKSLLANKPVINAQKCIRCGICIEQCPTRPKSIVWGSATPALPQYNYKSCIRCYCCQEACPEGAIEIKAPLLRKIADWFF